MSGRKIINFPHCDTSTKFCIRTSTTKLKNICLFDLTFLWLTGILRIGSHLQIETVPRPLPSFWRYSNLPFLRSYGCERKEKRHSSNDSIIHIRTNDILFEVYLAGVIFAYVVVVKDNFDEIIASSNRNTTTTTTNTNLKEKSMIVALTAMVSTSNRWEPLKKTRTFSWHSLTNILPQCRSLCSNMNVCSAMAMACATCSKMAKPWAALLRVIFSKSVPVK